MASPIEVIFEKIFGYLPDKSGTAYERLAAIAMCLLDDGVAQHDAQIRGQFSETLYQLDVQHRSQDGKTTMGEAKDYSESGKKVGRDDLQKLGGALPDLKEINAGAFFSSTGYTRPATKYANAATQITGGKDIDLYELTTSTEEDEKGFIKTIIIKVHAIIPHPESGEFRAAFTPEGETMLKDAFLSYGEQSKAFICGLSDFYTQTQTKSISLATLTSSGYGDVNNETNCVHASFLLPNQFIRVEKLFVPIRGLEYKIPFSYMNREIRISDDSEHRFVIRDENRKPLRILTDKKLREFSFDKYGNVVVV